MKNVTRCGTIAFLGEPNAGKSTLMNAILGEKIAAVHRKPHMTRRNMLGLLSEQDHQLIFIDTPGLHDSEKQVNTQMNARLAEALKEADVILALLEVHRPIPAFMDVIWEKFHTSKKFVFVLNKTDLPKRDWALSEEMMSEKYDAPLFLVSALRSNGVIPLVNKLKKLMPEHPFLYDADDLTTASMREIVGDFILETAMEFLHKEVPYELAVQLEEYRDTPKKVHIKACLVVNQPSQKSLVIGRGGDSIGRIRKFAEQEIKKLTGKYVSLSLMVKVDKGWLKSAQKIKEYVTKDL